MRYKVPTISFQLYTQRLVHREKILVIDDEEETRNILKDFFLLKGYEVETAADGEGALRKVGASPFDCIISDLVMPGMDGIELLKRIKTDDSKVMFLLITGYPSIESAVDAVKLGAYDYVSKPLRFEDLQIKVERALYTRSLEASVAKTGDMVRKLMVAVPILMLCAIIFALIFRKI